jgi:hypothetical protein
MYNLIIHAKANKNIYKDTLRFLSLLLYLAWAFLKANESYKKKILQKLEVCNPFKFLTFDKDIKKINHAIYAYNSTYKIT